MCEQISHDADFFFPTNTNHTDSATQTAVHVIGQHLPADSSGSATLLALSIRCNKWIGNYSNVHEFFLNLIGLVLLGSITKGQDICFWCFTLTSFPTTSPRDRIWNFNVNGTTRSFEETDKLDPAPYRGTLVPSKFTDTVRWLFLGW